MRGDEEGRGKEGAESVELGGAGESRRVDACGARSGLAGGRKSEGRTACGLDIECAAVTSHLARVGLGILSHRSCELVVGREGRRPGCAFGGFGGGALDSEVRADWLVEMEQASRADARCEALDVSKRGALRWGVSARSTEGLWEGTRTPRRLHRRFQFPLA